MNKQVTPRSNQISLPARRCHHLLNSHAPVIILRQVLFSSRGHKDERAAPYPGNIHTQVLCGAV